ncbi:phosphoinositide 3-kinase regulatory subunit 4-like [Branchiostoma lanceolatum]|uniref:phosphoinositide 3-kinase regulatory subunit 4-like n=1 Tax=Branchiostoma lanceolatum TaxID=7740 RepID=UPI0034540EB0
MGAQLTSIAPSQILSVDNYLTDVIDYEYDCSLGSTRFFKVARAKYKEGLAVVKVFPIYDPTLPLKQYKEELEDIKSKLEPASNCLPFQRVTLSEKAALLFRQYVRGNLYDRISTRPFLNSVEKRWIAFQLLCALNQAHKLKVCHGDIKTENVMVTGWNWVLLTDFASFKPTYLPEDHPADFSYFFDTSRRRVCYIAPERFVDVRQEEEMKKGNKMQTLLETSLAEEGLINVRLGDLTADMDIFSVGCVIAELFTEGSPLFDLSQLLAYKKEEFYPKHTLKKIEDEHIRELVEHMIQRDPAKRLSAEEYLKQWQGKAFPNYFYSFLKLYMGRFAGTPIMAPDDKVARLKNDLDKILMNLVQEEDDGTDGSEVRSDTAGLVVIISLITSTVRSLKFCVSKLMALELLLSMAEHVPSDIILDRLIPYMLFMVNDPFPHVRAAALKTLTRCLSFVKTVPRSDANIFPEYILPNLSHLTQDEVVAVRVAYAENIAVLAETALRFLELVQLNQGSDQDKDNDVVQDPSVQFQGSYDTELQALHEMIQQKVVTLLSDSENTVKQTLLENGITRLCVFFGRQKANDVLLSHMITFLNDKNDWHLRGAFFDCIVGVATYVGWQSSNILKPLLQQGLSDTEEFVICKSLNALTCLCELGLLQKPMVYDFASDVVPFLCHPNAWIRHGAVGFISAMARTLNVADVHCNLIPKLEPYIRMPIVQVDKEVVLLSVLKDPVPRPVYDYSLRSQLIEPLFDILQDRQLLRNLSTRKGERPVYTPPEDANLVQLLRKLNSQGMTEIHEDKLLSMKDFMLKLHKSRANSSENVTTNDDDEMNQAGKLNLGTLGRTVTRRHADLVKVTETRSDSTNNRQARGSSKKRPGPELSPMNEEWQSMFGSSSSEPKSLPAQTVKPAFQPDPLSQSLNQPIAASQGATPPTHQTKTISVNAPISMSQLQASTDAGGSPKKQPPVAERVPETRSSNVQVRHATCKMELRRLVQHKREQFAADMATKTLMETSVWETKSPPLGWRPKGQLVAHLHEHKAAVNRISVSHDHQFFSTCSNDGTVKIWDCQRMEGKGVTNRSRVTYTRQGGQIKCLTFCQSSHSVASASDNGSIQVIRVEPGTPRISILHSRELDLQEEGCVVDMNHFDTGSQSILVYATVHGNLVGWDLRAPGEAWKLKNDPKFGLITSFAVDHKQCWLGVGTSSGTHVCWDLRFQLPISTVNHPTGARVRKLCMHPTQQSWVISAVQGNNEVSMWDMETGARQMTLWASSAPPLSTSQASNHSVFSMYCSPGDGNPFLLTAGSDQRIRMWDLVYPDKSYVVAGAANDPVMSTSYVARMIDGTEVVQEASSKPRGGTNEDVPRRGPDTPPAGHQDTVTDIAVCQVAQSLILSCSRDGVIKVWK